MSQKGTIKFEPPEGDFFYPFPNVEYISVAVGDAVVLTAKIRINGQLKEVPIKLSRDQAKTVASDIKRELPKKSG
jgi:hypothetical protein